MSQSSLELQDICMYYACMQVFHSLLLKQFNSLKKWHVVVWLLSIICNDDRLFLLQRSLWPRGVYIIKDKKTSPAKYW